jgi:hypothetical protein
MVDSDQRKSLGNMRFHLEKLTSDQINDHFSVIRFIGELFKLRILSVKVMHQCILRLLSQPEDEDSLECLCVLLSTIGKELETPMQAPAGRSTSISVCIKALVLSVIYRKSYYYRFMSISPDES